MIRERLTMGVSAQCLQRPRRLGRLSGVVLLGVVLLAVALWALELLTPGAAEALEAQGWALRDQAGHTWSLTLLEQADPADPPGLRLRLTDRMGTQQLDHQRPLVVRDGMGGLWELANCSDELVPTGEEVLPAATAQFTLNGLTPRPRAELPLALEVPLEAGDSARLVAGATAVAALHDAGQQLADG
jgi:hypothetical protein